MAKDMEVRKDRKPSSSASASSSSSFLDPINDFDRMIDRFLGGRPVFGDFPSIAPRTQVSLEENDDNYVLYADIPGIPKEDLDVNVRGNLLTISAEHSEQEGEEGSRKGYTRQYRSFNQSISLPTTVDTDKVEAHCENGRLEILLPKTKKAQSKKVQVQSGKGGFLSRLMGKPNNQASRQQAPEKGQEKSQMKKNGEQKKH